MDNRKLVRIEVSFVNGALHDTILNPKDTINNDYCYVIETQDNKTLLYPFTSILRITEQFETVKDKPEDLEYGNA